jgi:hypothetical protein
MYGRTADIKTMTFHEIDLDFDFDGATAEALARLRPDKNPHAGAGSRFVVKALNGVASTIIGVWLS